MKFDEKFSDQIDGDFDYSSTSPGWRFGHFADPGFLGKTHFSDSACSSLPSPWGENGYRQMAREFPATI